MALIDSIKNRALFIGLGGTGQDILLEIRKRMINVFGEIPEKYFKFLAIDADLLTHNHNYEFIDKDNKKQSVNIGFNLGTENGYLEVTDFVNLVNGTPAMKEFCPDQYNQFAPAAIKGRGAGQVRMTGKLLLINKQSSIKAKINSNLHQLRNLDHTTGIAGKGIYVFVFGSLAGGTGSGMCVDIAHLIADCEDFRKEEDSLWGTFAMPCFFDKVPTRSRINFNAYGALRELEFWRNEAEILKANIKPFGIRELRPDPYDQILLVHSTFTSGVNIDYDGMLDAVATGTLTLTFHDTLSGMVNATTDQKLLTMGEKPRSFSSFGITEIFLKRERLIKYIIDRTIQKEIYKLIENNISQKITIESVSDFINENNLNEGIGEEAPIINQLTDLICPINESSLDNVKMADAATGADAATKIINAKENYITRLNKQLNTLFDSNDSKIEKIYQSIEGRINELRLVPGGISRAMKFVRNMTNQIKAMRSELEKEILTHKENISKIETQLETITENIKDAKGLFGWNKREQKSEIDRYRAIVSQGNSNRPNLSLKIQYIEIHRKEKAIAVYNDVLNLLSKYLNDIDENVRTGMLVSAHSKLSKALDEIEISIQQFKPKDHDGILINLHHFLKQIVDKEINEKSGEIVQSSSEIKDLFNRIDFNSDTSEEIIQKLREIIINENKNNNTLLAHLNDRSFSVEKFMLLYFDQKLNEKIIQLCNNSLSVMWTYKDMEFPPDGHDVRQDTIFTPVIGRYFFTSDEKKIFEEDSEFISGLQTLNLQSGVRIVDLLDPDRVVFYLQEDAVPAFKLRKVVEVYKKDYDQKKNLKRFYAFTDKRIEQINDSLFPLQGDPYRWWTLGCVLGQITMERKSYKIYSKNTQRGVLGMEDIVKESRGKANRKIAFEKFSEEPAYSDEIEALYLKELSDDKQGLKGKIIDYCNSILDRKNIGKGIDALEEGEESIIQKEKQILVDIALNELGLKEEDLVSEHFILREIKSLSN
jgi:hypothetical protein